MAGDWIKMRGNLWDDPRIARICDETGSSEATAIGALYWLWASADQHSEDGVMPGLTLRAIDRKTGIGGFGDALVSIGWLADHPEGVRITRFEDHNGISAKKRCVDAKRKAIVRDMSDKTRTNDGHSAEEKRGISELEEEKEKEKDIKPLKTKTEPRGTRLAPDWTAGDDLILFCKTERPDLDPQSMQDKFRDYWTGVPGRGGIKLNWPGTWKNFIRSERRQHRPAQTTKPEKFDPVAHVNRNRITQ